MNKEGIEISVMTIQSLHPNEDAAVRSRDPKRVEMSRALGERDDTHSLTCQSEQALASCL